MKVKVRNFLVRLLNLERTEMEVECERMKVEFGPYFEALRADKRQVTRRADRDRIPDYAIGMFVFQLYHLLYAAYYGFRYRQVASTDVKAQSWGSASHQLIWKQEKHTLLAEMARVKRELGQDILAARDYNNRHWDEVEKYRRQSHEEWLTL